MTTTPPLAPVKASPLLAPTKASPPGTTCNAPPSSRPSSAKTNPDSQPKPAIDDTCFDTVLKVADQWEKDGGCKTGCAGGLRFVWGTVELISRGLGGSWAAVNAIGLGLASGAFCFTRCCETGSEISNGLGHAAYDNLKIAGFAFGSIIPKTLLGMPTYFAKCCCREEVELCEKRTFRTIAGNCFSQVTSNNVETLSKKIHQFIKTSKYMKCVKTLSGTYAFSKTLRIYAHRKVGSVAT
jgi:hypothetical protein